jgi:flagellar biosynthesis protein FliR
MQPLPLESLLLAVLFVGLRISGLMLFAPVLSSQSVPAPLKIALTVALTALLYPVYRPLSLESGILGWAGILGGELVIGMLLGLALQLAVDAALVAGQMTGIQAGYSLVTLLDPQTQADTAVMGTFNQLIVLLIFLQFDVHHWLLRGLAASFVYLPPGSILAGARSGFGLVQAAGGIWLAGLQMAAPVIIATMLVDVALGFLAKASPQLPVLFLGLPLKNMLALSALTGSLLVWPRLFEQRFSSGIALGERLLHLAR